MFAKERLISSLQDEKAKLSFEHGGTNQYGGKRARARNPFNLVGSVILVLIALGLIRTIHIKYRDTLLGNNQVTCNKHFGSRQIVNFKDIVPSEKLEWHKCFGNVLCARLTVPMDYNRPLNVSKDNPKVHVALLLVPGRNHTNSGKYSKSPLLINPGGPGGSGVNFAQFGGHALQQVVGFDQDIIGFDPRGIGSTTPVADCYAFPSDGESKELTDEEISRGFFHKFLWALSGQETGLVNTSADSLEKLDTRSRANAKLCKTKDALYGEDSIFRHVSTPAVAQDMLSILDAWDAWREEKEDDEKNEITNKIESPKNMEDDKSLDTKGKLVYWGFSYGTLLGATFAAMFPDRVGRVILDGVVDADFYVSPVWQDSLLDTDKIMASFFHFCHKARKDCALYRDGDSQSDVKARFDEAYDNLKKNPILGVTPGGMTPTVVTHTIIHSVIFRILYSPIAAFPIMAEVMNMVSRRHERDEAGLLHIFASASSMNPDFFCSKSVFVGYEGRDAQNSIMCSDKRYPLNETISNWQARFEKMAQVSSFADVWMTLAISCDSWSINATDPPMRWDDHPAHNPDPIKTSFPLLFLSNTLDPVTPLNAAVKMAHKFVDAGLVEQHGGGHCSLAAASICTLMKVRAYLRDGTVPSPPEWGPEGHEIECGKWERCPRDDWPWKHKNAAWRLGGSFVEEERQDDEYASEESIVRAWSFLREAVITQLKFWDTRDMGVEVDWSRLMELRGGT